MLDNLDLDISLDKETYDAKIEVLMKQLRSLQKACWEKKLPAIIVLEGWAAAAKALWSKKWWVTWTRAGLPSTRFGRLRCRNGLSFYVAVLGETPRPRQNWLFLPQLVHSCFRRPIVRSSLQRRSTHSNQANQRLRAADGR